VTAYGTKGGACTWVFAPPEFHENLAKGFGNHGRFFGEAFDVFGLTKTLWMLITGGRYPWLASAEQRDKDPLPYLNSFAAEQLPDWCPWTAQNMLENPYAYRLDPIWTHLPSDLQQFLDAGFNPDPSARYTLAQLCSTEYGRSLGLDLPAPPAVPLAMPLLQDELEPVMGPRFEAADAVWSAAKAAPAVTPLPAAWQPAATSTIDQPYSAADCEWMMSMNAAPAAGGFCFLSAAVGPGTALSKAAQQPAAVAVIGDQEVVVASDAFDKYSFLPDDVFGSGGGDSGGANDNGGELQQLRSKVEQMAEEHQQLQRAHEALHRARAAADEHMGVLKQELHALQGKLADSEARNEEVQQQLDTANERVSVKDEQLDDLKGMLDAAKTAGEEAALKLQAVNGELSRAYQQLQQMRGVNEGVERRNAALRTELQRRAVRESALTVVKTEAAQQHAAEQCAAASHLQAQLQQAADCSSAAADSLHGYLIESRAREQRLFEDCHRLQKQLDSHTAAQQRAADQLAQQMAELAVEYNKVLEAAAVAGPSAPHLLADALDGTTPKLLGLCAAAWEQAAHVCTQQPLNRALTDTASARSGSTDGANPSSTNSTAISTNDDGVEDGVVLVEVMLREPSHKSAAAVISNSSSDGEGTPASRTHSAVKPGQQNRRHCSKSQQFTGAVHFLDKRLSKWGAAAATLITNLNVF